MWEYPWIFVNNLFKFCILDILYNAIMHKNGVAQSYCKDLLTRILNKFISYFSEFCIIYYKFLKFKWISKIFKSEMKFWKLINTWIVMAAIWPKASAQWENAGRPNHATDTTWAWSPRQAYARGGTAARSPAARRWSWWRGVLPSSKRAALAWRRARR
jgi:hypothetical protein